MNNYKTTKIWGIFSKKSNLISQSRIEEILDKTIPLLKEIKRTFPTYTNHDAEHSLKILKLVEMLLGDNIDKLSESELAVILLSAYWHDLGMMCHDKKEVLDEKWFDKKDEELTDDMVSNYLRINHHLRLEKYLFETDYILDNKNKSLLIQNNDVVDIAYNISMSHNYHTKDLEQFTKFSSNGSNDDFVFCSILLRLADIMDFDYERTPISSFKFLGLNNPRNNSEVISKSEWDKHKESLGFEYKNGILYFKAIPSNPEIEYSIREFIKVIENELEKSNQVFNFYCYKWRDTLKLPTEIDISGIKSQGYKFGDYKFSFDNEQILNLLTGDNIYSNKLIFIRELLQNAIDASMYREALEKIKSKPISFTDWHDQKDGSYWIRIDDYGIGMDEYVLLNYFTKIGKSFYESKDFNKSVNYKAISRFGIGILSCFMVASKVEVSTKKQDCEAIRFSIKSLHSYFITQLENSHKVVDFFPSSDTNEKQRYRKNVGTSIAIQIDFNKLNYWFELRDELKKHIFYSPIEIQYQNEKIGTIIEDLDKNPWIEKELQIELNDEDREKIASFFNIRNYDNQKDVKINFEISPIKLISHDFKIVVQMLIIKLNEHYAEGKIPIVLSSDVFTFQSALYHNSIEKKFEFRITKDYDKGKAKYQNETLKIDLEKYGINFTDKSKLGHNGIYIGEDFSNIFNERIINFITNDKNYAIAHIYLSNEFRPFLDISRSKEVKFDYQTISTVNLMMSKFITQNNLMSRTYDCSLIRNRFGDAITYDEILNDTNLEEWKNEKIFLTKGSYYRSLNEIQNQKVLNYPRINHFNIDYIYKSHTRQMFVLILISLFADGYLDENGNYYVEKILEKEKYQNVEDMNSTKYFPVGFFVKYHENIKDKLQLSYKHKVYAVNLEHPFAKWLLNNAETLNNKYRGIFEDIKSQFINNRGNSDYEKLKNLLFLLQKIDSNTIDFDIDSIFKSFK